jgi:hypothetical protein
LTAIFTTKACVAGGGAVGDRHTSHPVPLAKMTMTKNFTRRHITPSALSVGRLH